MMSRPPFERSEKLSHPDEPGPSHGISEPTARCFRGRLSFGQSQQNAKIFSFFLPRTPQIQPREEARPLSRPARGSKAPYPARAGLPRASCCPITHPTSHPKTSAWPVDGRGPVRICSRRSPPLTGRQLRSL